MRRTTTITATAIALPLTLALSLGAHGADGSEPATDPDQKRVELNTGAFKDSDGTRGGWRTAVTTPWGELEARTHRDVGNERRWAFGLRLAFSF